MDLRSKWKTEEPTNLSNCIIFKSTSDSEKSGKIKGSSHSEVSVKDHLNGEQMKKRKPRKENVYSETY